MTRMEQIDTTTAQQSPAAEPDDIDSVDIVLGVLTLVPLLFVLMFATSGMADRLKRRNSRRKLGAGLLAFEVVVTLAIVAWVLS